MTVKIIGLEKILDLNLDPAIFYDWIQEAIRLKEKSYLPAKISIPLFDKGFFNFMPSVIPDINKTGIKIVNRYPERIPSLDSQILLYDYETGKLQTMMDGNYVTVMRTGAVAVHSILLFARKDFETIGIIGLGNTARATLDILLRKISKKLKIHLLGYKDQENDFIERYRGHQNVEFVVEEEIDKLISNSDVVISCVTYTDDDFCDEKYFKPGCTVIPIHTRGFMGCDLSFDKVYADDTKHVSGFKNFGKFKKFCEVSEVVRGIAPGRENDDERILVYNIGISLHDVFFGDRISSIVCNDEFIDLHPPDRKYWI